MDPAKKMDPTESVDKEAATAAKSEAPQKLNETDLEVLLDIPLKVNVELGRTKILVNDLIKLHKGSVIELSKLAGEPLDLLVNDKVVAKGEVIVVNEKFGIRLSEIVSHTERIRQLGD